MSSSHSSSVFSALPACRADVGGHALGIDCKTHRIGCAQINECLVTGEASAMEDSESVLTAGLPSSAAEACMHTCAKRLDFRVPRAA